jgi:ribonuclease-3
MKNSGSTPVVSKPARSYGWLRRALGYLSLRPSIPELTRKQIRVVERRLQYRFRDPVHLAQALKHRSWVYAHDGEGIDSNERLEYLGDAVLDVIVAEFLYRRHEDLREGDLTQMKSVAVSRAVLARRARGIDLGRHILLSHEEREAGGGNQDSILSDAFEAVIGAIYIDGGLEPSRRFVESVVLHDIEELGRREDFINFKSRLLEHVQGLGAGHPRYLVQDEQGPDHEKIFSIDVSVTGETFGSGQGKSKKEAQQMAARDALQKLGQI